MSRIRTALIGCGKVGRLHAQALRALPESNFVAVCDASPERAEAFGAEFEARPFTSVAAMVRESKVQAVCLCTPHPLHREAAIAAMDAGAHVLVEKPLAANLADCDAMITAARRNGVQLGVVSQRRFFEPVQRMKAAIDAGEIGTPVLGTVLMLSWRDEAYYRSDPWRGRWDTEGGGVLVNQAPHHLDILQWLMGPVEEITGYCGNLNHPYIEVEDTAVANIRFRNGGLGSIVASLSQRPGIYSKIHIHGSNGASVGVETDTGATFVAGVSDTAQPPFNDIWTIPGAQHPPAPPVRGAHYYHELQIHEFLDAMLNGRPPAVTGEDGRKVVEMFTAIYESSRRGKQR